MLREVLNLVSKEMEELYAAVAPAQIQLLKTFRLRYEK